jgi:hypothetical protein
MLAVSPAAARPATDQTDYLVLIPGHDSPFAGAAKRIAYSRNGRIDTCDFDQPDELLKKLQAARPEFVVFVMPPEMIDVDRVRGLLALSTQVDSDPFVDFEYSFITGRDGPSAERFVERIIAARRRPMGSKAAVYGSWEGAVIPRSNPTAANACNLKLTEHYVRVSEPAEQKAKRSRELFAKLGGHDLLLLFSHGYPDQMVECFRGNELREWNIDLSPAVMINCACYNGAPGRWYEMRWQEPSVDRGVVAPEDSVALAMIDSGVTAYVAGINPWHGPLANQMFGYVAAEGMRLGEASKWMADRLALEFLPEPIEYPPEGEYRFAGEGTANRRANGAGMICYGDPAWAPFEHVAAGQMRAMATWPAEAISGASILIEVDPLVERGQPGSDFMLAQNRLLNYYSVRDGAKLMDQLRYEVYRVVPLPESISADDIASLKVVRAETTAGAPLPTGEPQLVTEDRRGKKFLHVRVPIEIPAFGSAVSWQPVVQGIRIELAPR